MKYILGILFAIIFVANLTSQKVINSYKNTKIINNEIQKPSLDLDVKSFTKQSQSTNIYINFIGSWTSEAQNALVFAASIWDNYIQSDVTIEIDAEWDSFPLVLGELGRYDMGTVVHSSLINSTHPALIPGTAYPSALANKLNGTDLTPNESDMTISFNNAFTDWHFGFIGACPLDKIDFVTLALKQIGHGLGLSSSVRLGGGFVYGYHLVNGNHVPLIYDRFLTYSNGIKMTDFNYSGSNLSSFVVSDDVYWDGSKALGANNWDSIKIHAPQIWDYYGNLNNLDDSYKGSYHGLMTFNLTYGEKIHHLGEIGKGMLNDIGWGSGLSPNNLIVEFLNEISADTFNNKNCASINITYQASATTNYEIKYKSELGSWVTAFPPTGTNNYIINGLNETKDYEFFVIARNNYGASYSTIYTREKCGIKNPIMLYPNPFIESIIFEYYNISDVSIIDINNPRYRWRFTRRDFERVNENQTRLNLAMLPVGTYEIILRDNEQNEWHERIIKRE